MNSLSSRRNSLFKYPSKNQSDEKNTSPAPRRISRSNAKVNHLVLNQFIKQKIELSINNHKNGDGMARSENNAKLFNSPYLSVIKTKDNSGATNIKPKKIITKNKFSINNPKNTSNIIDEEDVDDELNNSNLAINSNLNNESDMFKNAFKVEKKSKKDDPVNLKNKYKFDARFTMKLNEDDIGD